MLASEKWLLQNGLITETSADNLLGYAYMLPGVEKANLKIDLDTANLGVNPSVTYEVELEKVLSKKYALFKKHLDQKDLFSKVLVLGLFQLKIPTPGYFENEITLLAKRYLPENYKVIVNVR